jgi:histidinol phosphatase-like PHP family hydrolase
MKRWRRYENLLQEGDWHVHSNYVDGNHSIDEICREAQKRGLKLINICEHVRRELDYDYSSLLNEIITSRTAYSLVILAGAEAKVLDTFGSLDVPDDLARSCDVLTGVFHSFAPATKQDYLLALHAMLKDPLVDIWGHPMRWLADKGFELNDIDVVDVIDLCIQYDVLIEYNLKYKVPSDKFLRIAYAKGAKIVVGSDAHGIDAIADEVNLDRRWSGQNSP